MTLFECIPFKPGLERFFKLQLPSLQETAVKAPAGQLQLRGLLTMWSARLGDG